MDARPLIRRARLILEDNVSDVKKGIFWSDYEIVLALNAAQNMFVAYCVRNKLHNHIQGLYKNTNYLNNNDPLPNDYMHGVSALIGINENNLEATRLYYGGEAEIYRYNVTQSMCGIIGNIILFYIRGTPAGGILNYYRKPTYLNFINPSNVMDFNEEIYFNTIAVLAARILGIKETQNTRDIKRHVKMKISTDKHPLNIANYVKIYDYDVEHITTIK